MIIHPSVTSSSSSVSARSTAGNATTTTSYPVIDVREAQTQVMIKDGETIVIGGLLKDVKGKETIGIPFLSKIPLLGKLFNREIEDNEKVDLLIFITARIIKEGEFTAEEITRLQKGLSSIPEKEIKASKKTKQ
jgi:type II secretory pathway component GspD/PulD (secretin)